MRRAACMPAESSGSMPPANRELQTSDIGLPCLYHVESRTLARSQ
jgi:hypothetical protein